MFKWRRQPVEKRLYEVDSKVDFRDEEIEVRSNLTFDEAFRIFVDKICGGYYWVKMIRVDEHRTIGFHTGR